MPFKLVLRLAFGITGAAGVSKAVQSPATAGMPDTIVQETLAVSQVPEARVHVGHAVSDQPPGADSADRDWIIDKIGEVVEENADKGETNLDDFSDEELQRQAEMPRNSKKRMYEATDMPQYPRDEL